MGNNTKSGITLVILAYYKNCFFNEAIKKDSLLVIPDKRTCGSWLAITMSNFYVL